MQKKYINWNDNKHIKSFHEHTPINNRIVSIAYIVVKVIIGRYLKSKYVVHRLLNTSKTCGTEFFTAKPAANTDQNVGDIFLSHDLQDTFSSSMLAVVIVKDHL